MILRDRITVLVRTQPLDEYGNPAEDAYGNPLPPVNVEAPPIPAELSPLDSGETLSADRAVVVTRYRVVVGPRVTITPTSAIRWRGVAYEVNGDLEAHTAGGRTRHHEFVIRRAQ